MTRTPQQGTEITNETQAGKARERLADANRLLATIAEDYADVSRKIGQALAAIELGDKKAGTTAGALSLKRVGLENERRDLTLLRDALAASLTTWDEADTERQGRAALTALAAITADARALEEQLGEQLTAAAETARALIASGVEWQRARRAAGHFGDVRAFDRAPRIPARVGMLAELIDDPVRIVNAWLGKPVTRKLDGRALAQLEDREASNAAQQANRTEPTTFTVVTTKMSDRARQAVTR